MSNIKKNTIMLLNDKLSKYCIKFEIDGIPKGTFTTKDNKIFTSKDNKYFVTANNI